MKCAPLHDSFPRPSDERPEHALDHQFLRRDEVGVFRVFRLEKGLVVFEHESFQRAIAVHERGHNLAVLRLRPVLQNHDVALADMTANHGIAHHAQRKGVAGRLETNRLDVHRDAALGLLLPFLPEASRNGTEEWYLRDEAAEFGQRGNDPQRSCFTAFRLDKPFTPKRFQMTGRGSMTAKTKPMGDFTERWDGSAGLGFGLDEIQ